MILIGNTSNVLFVVKNYIHPTMMTHLMCCRSIVKNAVQKWTEKGNKRTILRSDITQDMFETKDYELWQGDCLELMKNIPDKSVDMILCDLPYGKTQNEKDVCLPFDKLWNKYKRIIKDNGCIALFGQGTFYVDLVNSNRKMFRYDLVWNKELTSGFLNAKRMPLRQHEQIAIFYKKLSIYNPQFSIGKPLHSKGKSYKDKPIKNQNYGDFKATDDVRAGSTDKYPTSIFSFSKPHPSVAVHRTEKPTALLEYLIKTYTNEGDVVLDNCMGSGSTGVACINTNRNFVGIELDEGYFKIAKQRIENTRTPKERGADE